MQPTVAQHVISVAAAQAVVEGASAAAVERGVAVCIAVTDACGHLVVYVRMDGAPFLSAQIAQNKAYSVVAFNGMATHEWWSHLQGEPALLAGIVKTDRLVVFGGGLPLSSGSDCVGAIGVSGGAVDDDLAIGEAGATAFRQVTEA